MQNLRTFTSADWDGFAGASKLPDGTGPYITEFENPYGHHVELLVSGLEHETDGSAIVEAYVYRRHSQEPGDYSVDVYCLPCKTPALAMLIADALKPDHFTSAMLASFGFICAG
jgi:hypothetical protein